MGVRSFDVFDTVLTRTVGGPSQVFAVTGRRLRDSGGLDVEPAVYAAARAEAGRDLTADIAHHPSQRRIADEVVARLGLPPDAADAILDAELAVEREVCRAVPGWPARLDRHREAGHQVVFVSDTSLPPDFLRDLLAREQLFRAGDRLFTSAAAGASKQDGELFDVVADELGLPPAQLSHRGDDRWSDLAHARTHGWQAALDTRAHFTSHERRLDRSGVATDGLGPRLAAASRLGRLAAVDADLDPAIARIAGGVALPLLAGFGLWVLRQAELLALDRLYFVSRDGEVFREMTQRLAQQGGDVVECRYLYGSRRSWQLAATGTAGYDRTSAPWIPDDVEPGSLTPRQVLHLVDLTPADALGLLAAPEFEPGQADEPLGADGWSRVQGLLTAGPLAQETQRRGHERRDLLLRYLDQEGVTGAGRVGLVDVGWTGRAARALEDVLLDGDRSLPAAHLFLGLSEGAPRLMGPDLHGRSHGWLLDETRGRGSRSRRGEDPVMLVESFAMGREGHTVGYQAEGTTVRPTLVAADNPAAQSWRFADFRAALSLTLDALVDGPQLDRGVDLRALAWDQLLGFWRTPSREEALAWGAQPYGEDFANASTHPLATPVTGRRMLTRLGLGPPRWREPTYWLAGTVAVSPQPWRSALRAADRGQQLAARLPRVRDRLRGEWAMRRRSGPAD